MREFDIVAVGGERIFLNETKSNPRMEYAREFVESLEDFFEWLPRYRHLELVPVFSSLRSRCGANGRYDLRRARPFPLSGAGA